MAPSKDFSCGPFGPFLVSSGPPPVLLVLVLPSVLLALLGPRVGLSKQCSFIRAGIPNRRLPQ